MDLNPNIAIISRSKVGQSAPMKRASNRLAAAFLVAVVCGSASTAEAGRRVRGGTTQAAPDQSQQRGGVVSKLSNLPSVPRIPGVKVPGIPGIPGIKGIPGVPGLGSLPGLIGKLR